MIGSGMVLLLQSVNDSNGVQLPIRFIDRSLDAARNIDKITRSDTPDITETQYNIL